MNEWNLCCRFLNKGVERYCVSAVLISPLLLQWFVWQHHSRHYLHLPGSAQPHLHPSGGRVPAQPAPLPHSQGNDGHAVGHCFIFSWFFFGNCGFSHVLIPLHAVFTSCLPKNLRPWRRFINSFHVSGRADLCLLTFYCFPFMVCPSCWPNLHHEKRKERVSGRDASLLSF